MAKDPDKRFNNAGDMGHIIFALGEKIDQVMRERSLKNNNNNIRLNLPLDWSYFDNKILRYI
jgi:hypothetical protein